MHRRHLLRTSTLLASSLSLALPIDAVLARQTPEASPAPRDMPEDQPVDPRARQLVARLAGLPPLAMLEALETGEVTEPGLTGAADGPVSARPWNDPLDTDLEHALGGVLVVASDDPVNSPELVTLGAYIVFESPEIAYLMLSRQLEELGNSASMSVAGTKAWLASADDGQLAIMRLNYVLVIAGESMTAPGVAGGLVEHLDALTQAMR